MRPNFWGKTMDTRKAFALMGAGALLLPLATAGAEPTQLTAREMFYTAPATAPPPAKPVAPVKPVTPAKPVAPATAKTQPPVTQAKTPPAATGQVETAVARPAGQPGKIVPVAYRPRVPLGVRYSILKKTDDEQVVEVDAAGVFRAGDRIRVSVEVNDTAHLYIVNRGSSGAWKVLFPSAEIEGGNNRVEAGRRYEIPAGYVFTFDEQPGVEKLFLVLSRQPEADLENLIYSLSQRPAQAPPEQPAEEKGAKWLLAQNMAPIGDGLIGKLRNAYARDLIIEKVDQSTPGEKKETAVYVVNKTAARDSRVVIDIALNHR